MLRALHCAAGSPLHVFVFDMCNLTSMGVSSRVHDLKKQLEGRTMGKLGWEWGVPNTCVSVG